MKTPIGRLLINGLVVVSLLLAAAALANTGSVRAQDEILYAGDGLSLPEEQAAVIPLPEINHAPGEGPALPVEPQAADKLAPDGTPLDALNVAPEEIAPPEVDASMQGVLGADPQAGASEVLPNGGGGIPTATVNFVTLSIGSNISAKVTFLDSPSLNQLPARSFLATTVLNPLGAVTAYHNHPLGAFYSTTTAQWSVFNEDVVDMPTGVAFNIFTPPQNSTFFTHTATAGNTSNDLTRLDNAYLNNHPEAKVFAMPVYNPGGGSSGAYYNHKIGVYYEVATGRWGIYNEDAAAIPADSTFFVYVSQGFTQTFTQVTTADNTPGNYTILDSPLLNNNPNAVINVMHDWGTSGSGAYYNQVLGVWYSPSMEKWTIFNNVATAMPVGLKFTVLIQPKKEGSFIFTATTSNIMPGINDHVAVIDHPLLNDNPNALVYAIHNWNPPNTTFRDVDIHPLGVLYTSNRWTVYHTDFEAMTPGSTYNIFVTFPQANAYATEVGAQNSTASTLHLNHPQLNSHTGAAFIEIENFNPGELITGRTYGFPTYAAYGSGIWNILRVGGPNFDISSPTLTTAFNVLLPKTNAFVHTTTSPNKPYNGGTCINSPLTNNKPGVKVFAYVNGTPAGGGGVYQGNPIGVFYYVDWNQWCVYLENGTDLAVGTAFNVFVYSGDMYLPLIVK